MRDCGASERSFEPKAMGPAYDNFRTLAGGVPMKKRSKEPDAIKGVIVSFTAPARCAKVTIILEEADDGVQARPF